MNEKQGKKCFIITPIGNENSDTFRKAKGVIDSVIKPILIKYDFIEIKPSYEIMESGMIGTQIMNRLINDDLVVANLTGNNPNVMYELAIRHAIAKPVIHICEKGTILPFDINGNRTAFYTDDMLGVKELQNNFEHYVASIDYFCEYKDNPVYNGLGIENVIRVNNKKERCIGIEDFKRLLENFHTELKKEIPLAIKSKMETDYFQSRTMFHADEKQESDGLLTYEEIDVLLKQLAGEE